MLHMPVALGGAQNHCSAVPKRKEREHDTGTGHQHPHTGATGVGDADKLEAHSAHMHRKLHSVCAYLTAMTMRPQNTFSSQIPPQRQILGRLNMFVGVISPGPMFTMAQYMVLLR